ncbi:MAG: YraN family protein [Microthrixaceae bacterium]|nr:YraN family protein [Microthrixaceae bacterium]MCO5311981.1 YraN family protein [Microthrixaceae bacterium]HPB46075.1 YraN family protein [Microthrixaceae bacterium]
MSTQRSTIGRDGETVAANWYLRAGYEIEARNWHCREGELDIVAHRIDERGVACVVVCEVKTRSSARFGSAAEAVTRSKQYKIRAATVRYLAQRDGGPCSIRFDVAVVDRSPHGYGVRVIEGAF